MSNGYSRPARLAAVVISVTALAMLALQTTLNLERDGSPFVAAGLLLRFFTIWGNLAAGLIMGWVALGRRIAAPVLHALASALTVVGLVYWTLLASEHHPEGMDRVTNQFHHTVVPLTTILWWLVFGRRPASVWRSLSVVMLGPVAYAVFAIAYGGVSGFYPYFFLDRSSLGWRQLAVNIAGLALFFAAMGGILLGLKRLVSPRA
jgi:hypothetical protein